MPIWGLQTWNTVLSVSIIMYLMFPDQCTIYSVVIDFMEEYLMLFIMVSFSVHLVSYFFSIFSSDSLSVSLFPTINSSVHSPHCKIQQSRRVLKPQLRWKVFPSSRPIWSTLQAQALCLLFSSISALSTRQLSVAFCTL